MKLPLVDQEELITDARTSLRYATHPLVNAGMASLLAVPLVGTEGTRATLWVGTFRPGAFDARTVRQLSGWARLLERQLIPHDERPLYRRFLTLMNAPAIYVHRDEVLLNAAAEALTGFASAELSSLDRWFEALHGEDAPTARAMYELDRQQGLASTRVTALRRKDGSDRMVEIALRREGQHEVWLLHDVTERVASQERFRVLFEQSSTALALYDETGFLDCNPAAVALLGYASKSDVLERQPALVSPPTQPNGKRSADVLARMETIALAQGSHRFDWVYRTAQGAEAPVEVTLTPLVLGHRRVLLAEWHDISERLRYEEGLKAARDSALSFARARSDFLATMSHEIRTPMNGVIGMTRLLAETGLTAQQREYVDTVRACGEGLLALINDILDFSRLEAGKVQLERIPFAVREVVEDAVAVVAPQAHGKRLELSCRIAPEVPALTWGDPRRIRQVLLNLLGNAVKFTHEGRVEVAVEAVPHVSGEVMLVFAVKDTGVGIAPEALPRLFSAFSQEDGSTTRRFGGSGLGLAICRGLTQLMQGALDVDSQQPGGSVFTVALPLEVHTAHVERPALTGKLLAVLDDRETSRAALEALISAAGAHLTADPAEADLVLVDQGMGDGRGAELAARIARYEKPVGFLRRLDGARLDESTFAFVLPTPVREAALYQQLSRVLLAAPAPLAQQPAPYRQFGARVLVAEDNPVNQRVVVGLLSKLGCVVELAGNGEHAVEAFSRGAFDLIFMDCQMPVMDGFAATRRIRASQHAHVPIVALTAGVMEGDRERCFEAGMDDFLAKPVRLEDLERALARHLDDDGAQTATA
ncbi:MAG: response regulator [Myxococcota bacterium]